MRWFRWYRGTAERAKFRVIADRASCAGAGGHGGRIDGVVLLTDVLAVWVTLLEDAGNASHWGYVTRDARYVATLLDLNVTEVESILSCMIDEEMIENGGKGGKKGLYHIVNWERYQFTSDTDPTSAERQKRYRERRARNALLTRTDTDTDTDIRKESPKRERQARAKPLPPDWKPTDDSYAYGKNLGLSDTQVDDMAESMRLWAMSASGSNTLKKDWDLAFKAWMRRERTKPNGHAPPYRKAPLPGGAPQFKPEKPIKIATLAERQAQVERIKQR